MEASISLAIELSKSNGLNFITAPYFPETVDFLENNNVDAIKVSKGDVNNVILIDKIAKTQLPIIIDAREKLEDIDKAIHYLELLKEIYYNGKT